MNWTYLVKAVYAGAVTLLGAVGAILVGSEQLGFGDITSGQWITIALATLVAVGGVLGLQSAPASVATSVRPDAG
jgi:hypothetical protein